MSEAILAVVGVALAAFAIWLTVRIITRREKWAKRTLAAIVGLPVIYVLSIDPVCWFTSRTGIEGSHRLSSCYRPLMKTCRVTPRPLAQFIYWYSCAGAADRWAWHYANDADEFDWSGHTYPAGKPRFPIPWE